MAEAHTSATPQKRASSSSTEVASAATNRRWGLPSTRYSSVSSPLTGASVSIRTDATTSALGQWWVTSSASSGAVVAGGAGSPTVTVSSSATVPYTGSVTWKVYTSPTVSGAAGVSRHSPSPRPSTSAATGAIASSSRPRSGV